MFRGQMPKILLQHNLPLAVIAPIRFNETLWKVFPIFGRGFIPAA
jgi:hypothetical protein